MAAESLSALASLERLVNSWERAPAFAYDRHLDVVSANRAAQATFGITTGMNLARLVYLSADVDLEAAESAELRETIAGSLWETLEAYGEDERFTVLVGELMSVSPAFAEDWAQRPNAVHSGRVACARLGGATLNFEILTSPAFGDVRVTVVTRIRR